MRSNHVASAFGDIVDDVCTFLCYIQAVFLTFDMRGSAQSGAYC
jgi:hypothetical protein